MERRATVYQFHRRDIERVCKTLSCSRAQLARPLGVSRACVSRWEKGLRAPQGGDAARLRALVGEHAGPAVDVVDLRAKLGMTQRVFGAQFGVSRQQVQKWGERNSRTPSEPRRQAREARRHGNDSHTAGLASRYAHRERRGNVHQHHRKDDSQGGQGRPVTLRGGHIARSMAEEPPVLDQARRPRVIQDERLRPVLQEGALGARESQTGTGRVRCCVLLTRLGRSDEPSRRDFLSAKREATERRSTPSLDD